MGGWVGQLGWVGGLPGSEAAPQGPPAPPPPPLVSKGLARVLCHNLCLPQNMWPPEEHTTGGGGSGASWVESICRLHSPTQGSHSVVSASAPPPPPAPAPPPSLLCPPQVWNLETPALQPPSLDSAEQELHPNPVFTPSSRLSVASPQCQPVRVYAGHSQKILDCAFSAAGDRLASASKDGLLRVWDTTRGTALATMHGHKGPVVGCCFAPSGAHVVSASADKTLRIWNSLTGACMQMLRGHTKALTGCCWSSAGRHIASSSYDGTIKV